MRVSPVAAPVREQVLGSLRTAIFDRVFAPGQRLIERELCELTGVSRTSVREALRQLESEGLVTIVPNRGPIVTRISAAEAADLYDVRGALEALAAREFADRASDSQVAALRAAVERIERSADGSPAMLLAGKDHFYDVLLEGAHNVILVRVLESLRARVTHLRATSLHRPGRFANTATELRAVLAAVEARDPDAAWAAALHHVQQAAGVAQEVLTEEETAS